MMAAVNVDVTERASWARLQQLRMLNEDLEQENERLETENRVLRAALARWRTPARRGGAGGVCAVGGAVRAAVAGRVVM